MDDIEQDAKLAHDSTAFAGPSALASFVAAILLIAVGMIIPLTPPTNPDLAYLLHSAGAWNDGATPYVDILDINPPLILALKIPVVWLAEATGAPVIPTFTVVVGCLVLLSIATVLWILRDTLLSRPSALRASGLVLLLVLLTLTGRNFGQREHLMLIFAGPYLAVATVRLNREGVPRRNAVLAGAVAGLGFALKPYFGVMFLATEALIWIRRREQGGSLVRPENLAVCFVIAAYSALVIGLTPEYFQMMAVFGDLYMGYQPAPLEEHLTHPALLFSGAALLAYRLVSLGDRWKSVADILSGAIFAAAVGAALQQKAYTYHYFPTFALSILLLAVVTAGGGQKLTPSRAGIARCVAGALLIMGIIGGVAAIPGIVGDSKTRCERLRLIVDQVRARCATPRIAVFSPDQASAFPMANLPGIEWGLSILSLWPLSAVYEEDVREGRVITWNSDSGAPRSEAYLEETVVADVTSRPPDLILVDRLASRRAFGGNGFDYISYYRRNPRFRDLMTRYELLGHWAGYRAYGRSDPGACIPDRAGRHRSPAEPRQRAE